MQLAAGGEAVAPPVAPSLAGSQTRIDQNGGPSSHVFIPNTSSSNMPVPVSAGVTVSTGPALQTPLGARRRTGVVGSFRKSSMVSFPALNINRIYMC